MSAEMGGYPDKGWGDIFRVILPVVINAVTKSQEKVLPGGSAELGGFSDKGWGDIFRVILPVVINAVTKSQEKVLPGGCVPPWPGSNPWLATKGAQGGDGDEKFWSLLVPILTAAVPAVIRAATKEGGIHAPVPQKAADEKFLSLLVPIFAAAIPAVIEAVTKEKGIGGSFGGGFSTPVGGFTGGGSVQIGKGWEDVIRVLPDILPVLIGAATKGTGGQAQFDQEKFLNFLPFILPIVAAIANR